MLINLIFLMNLGALACTLRKQRTLRYAATDSPPPSHPPTLHSAVNTLFSFCKNVAFPVQAEYSYFSADFRLKIFLYSLIIAFDIFVLECIGVKIEVNARFFVFVFVKTQNYILFKISALGLFLSYCYNCANFQPRFSYRISC